MFLVTDLVIHSNKPWEMDPTARAVFLNLGNLNMCKLQIPKWLAGEFWESVHISSKLPRLRNLP